MEEKSTSNYIEISDELKDEIIEQIKLVYDPEISVNIWELGLIYDIQLIDEHSAFVLMTLTSAACPSAQELPAEIEEKVKMIPKIHDCKVEVTFDPPWDKDMMSDEAKIELGFL